MSNPPKGISIYFEKAFMEWSGEKLERVVPLPPQGSDRHYFRLFGKTRTAIGVTNHDRRENEAFITFSNHFISLGLPVPKIYSTDLDQGAYVEEDLGNETLFSYLTARRRKAGFAEDIIAIYRKTLELLPRFQIEAAKDLDFDKCYPRHSFDRQSMMWDLNYFKYYFLKLAGIHFDEQYLENDFITFTKYLLDTDTEYFLYRDFQSRNIMICQSDVYFIDYQGGRKGALQYDPASLLYDAKADIPQQVRNELLDHYLTALQEHITIDRETFLGHYYGYVYIRIMQALGAYGYRGYYQKKEHFLKSIPYAIENLKWLNANVKLPVEIPMLEKVWGELVRVHEENQLRNAKDKLTIKIYSFSYKEGIPEDDSGNGGGFVFDCRAIKNPGREPQYADLTGNDEPVIEYLDDSQAMQSFLKGIYDIIDISVETYVRRKFTNLQVAFGCTGGQHRSVYSANQLYNYLKSKYSVNVRLIHRELEKRKLTDGKSGQE